MLTVAELKDMFASSGTSDRVLSSKSMPDFGAALRVTTTGDVLDDSLGLGGEADVLDLSGGNGEGNAEGNGEGVGPPAMAGGGGGEGGGGGAVDPVAQINKLIAERNALRSRG